MVSCTTDCSSRHGGLASSTPSLLLMSGMRGVDEEATAITLGHFIFAQGSSRGRLGPGHVPRCGYWCGFDDENLQGNHGAFQKAHVLRLKHPTYPVHQYVALDVSHVKTIGADSHDFDEQDELF
ncbi:hypothetical protein GOP47_0024683 [Adiantum capillus-veneris]|uniref:Uncharacterized protein n=1 Tax=Adiantum capillus-veneris TaxID=13818 RepID=A0A9D4Z2W2_ADICA|nr:hypothetical protein GOP47_0024683 [Adiantum capillus-veneris]